MFRMSATDVVERELPKLLYSVEESAIVLGIGRTQMFELISTGELASVKLGRRRLIPRAALIDLVARLTNTAA
jgi:excisionase family DNA binding protein